MQYLPAGLLSACWCCWEVDGVRSVVSRKCAQLSCATTYCYCANGKGSRESNRGQRNESGFGGGVLRMDGLVVRALVRPASDLAVLRGSGAELVVGDLRNSESLRRACQGCDAVVTTASSLQTSTGFDPEWTDRNGNLNLIEAARQENVGHVVFTSTIGADALDAPRIFRNKRLIEERLAASGLRHTILRPAGFMENLLPLADLSAIDHHVVVVRGSSHPRT